MSDKQKHRITNLWEARGILHFHPGVKKVENSAVSVNNRYRVVTDSDGIHVTDLPDNCSWNVRSCFAGDDGNLYWLIELYRGK